MKLNGMPQIMNRYAASDVMPDVFLMLSNSSYRQWKEEGKMRNLSSLLEQYGQGILNEVPRNILAAIWRRGKFMPSPVLMIGPMHSDSNTATRLQRVWASHGKGEASFRPHGNF